MLLCWWWFFLLVVMLLCWLVVSLWTVAQVPSLRRYERTMREKKVRFPIAEVWTRSPRTWIHSGSWLPSCLMIGKRWEETFGNIWKWMGKYIYDIKLGKHDTVQGYYTIHKL